MTRLLSHLMPRLFVTGLVAAVLASATITFAAVGGKAPTAPVKPPATAAKPNVRVPDVTGEAYVFAKGILEDAGFAWKVSGAEGFAVNLVLGQSPRAGALVVDTGAPLVSLTLSRNAKYRELGTPENRSPYAATPLLRPGQKLGAKVKKAAKGAKTAKAAKAKPAAKPKVKPAAKPKAKPAAKPKAKPAAKPKAKPAAKPKAKPAAKPNTAPAAKSQPSTQSYGSTKLSVGSRPPAFHVTGAPAEPLDEMPLPDRARMLGSWLSTHQKKTDANLKHWSYQHAWLVYGAKFGWWHGAEALEILIQVDQRAQKLWGVGADSEQVARGTLTLVQQKSG